jgi:hypothetical protein
MNFRQRLLRFLEPIAIPHVALYIVIGQLIVLVAEMAQRLSGDRLWLVPGAVLAGQWWRVLTFVFEPPNVHWALVAFGWWIFYLMGNALEGHWGVLRFNLYLLLGWALTVAVSFVTPWSVATNLFFLGSVFLAFAYLAPEFELLLFFVLPVKIKWLALITWCGYAFELFTGTWSTRFGILAATATFLVFFARDMWMSMRAHQRRTTFAAQHVTDDREPRHRCRICGKDSNTHPQLDFRYCSKCAGAQCYCPEHLANHEHVLVDETAEK